MLNATHNPLRNRRIVVTRAEAKGAAFAAQLHACGAVPLLCPVIAYALPADTAALGQALGLVANYDWLLLTSAQAAHVVCEKLEPPLLPRSLHVAAVGPATAQVLRAAGVAVALVPAEHSANGLLAEIGDVFGKRVLLPAADIAGSSLADGLRTRGATVDAVVAYRTVPGPGVGQLAPLLQAGTVDAVTFTSSSTVRYLIEGLAALGIGPSEAVSLLNRCVLACIGPQTAASARSYQLTVVEAETASAEGLVATLISQFSTAATRR